MKNWNIPVRSLSDAKSPGVQRIEAMSQVITIWDRIFLFASIFLVSYVYGLDGQTRSTYQTYATNSFKEHSLTSTVNIFQTIIGAAAQPTAAKIADVFGRTEVVALSVFFYVLGTIVEAVSGNIPTFSGGAVLYTIGYTMIQLLVEVIIADMTSTRSRVLFSYIPALPFIINTWISGNMTSTVLHNTTWKWGIGMWTIIYTVCALPLLFELWFISYRAKRRGLLDGEHTRTLYQQLGFKKMVTELFWLLDVVGIILMIAVFALILAPLTLAGGLTEKWKQGYIIAPLVVGFVCIPIFVVWEFYAPHPILPLWRLKDRAIWAPIGIGLFLDFSWYMQGDYLYTILQVSFNESVLSATRISSMYSFASVITGAIAGLIIYYVKRVKIFMILGICLWMAAFGILYVYRGGTDSGSHSGVIGGQVALGIAGGLFPYPAQATIQAFVPHEVMGVVTGLYLALYRVGSGFGVAVSGAVWTQVLPKQLEKRVGPLNKTAASYMYESPLSAIIDYPVGTPERSAMLEAYRYVQRLLIIIGLCLGVPLLFFGLASPNPHLSKKQTLVTEKTDPTDDATSDKLPAAEDISMGGHDEKSAFPRSEVVSSSPVNEATNESEHESEHELEQVAEALAHPNNSAFEIADPENDPGKTSRRGFWRRVADELI